MYKALLRTPLGCKMASIVFTAALATFLPVFQTLAATATNFQLVSGPVLPCRSAAGDSFAPTLTPDGRYVLFYSNARNLVTNGFSSPYLNAYVRDLSNNTTVLASLGPSNLLDISNSVSSLTISSNGQFVAFVQKFGTNRSFYACVRDLNSGITTVQSIYTNGNPRVTPKAMLTADAHWLYFQEPILYPSEGAGGGGPFSQIYARDLISNRTERVTTGTDLYSQYLTYSKVDISSLSSDGRFSAYVSTAQNHGDFSTELYVRDLYSPLPTWASTNVHFSYPWLYANAAISTDGQCVAFWAQVNSGSNSILYHHRLDTATTTPLLTNFNAYFSALEISSDGRFVAYDDATNVFLWDSQLQTNLLISVNRNGTGPGNDGSRISTITPDARFVLFLSSATDLVTNPANGKFQVYLRDMLAETTRLVTINTNGAASDADLESAQPVISNDGCIVAFESPASDLVPDDLNQASDVFVRDMLAGTTQLVSEREISRPALTSAGFSTRGGSASCKRWVASTSSDGNLVPNDTNGLSDLFLRDLLSNTSQVVNLGTNLPSDFALSADGRYIAYTIPWTNDRIMGTVGDIYRYDRQLGSSVLVSATMDGSPGGNSSTPAISPDGRYIAFKSFATNMSPFPMYIPSWNSQIYIRDLQLQTNIPAVLDWLGYLGFLDSTDPQFSPDGRWFLFRSDEDFFQNYSGPNLSSFLYARDMLSGATVPVSTVPNDAYGDALDASISADSRYVVFVTNDRTNVWVRDLQGDSNAVLIATPIYPYSSSSLFHPGISSGGRMITFEQRNFAYYWKSQVVLKDRQTGTTNIISINKTGTTPGNDASSDPLITPDGQFVIFASKASDLVEGDTNGFSDIFVRDRLRNITMLISVNAQGQPANGPSMSPVLAGDGRTVLFQSFASDLVEGDYNMKGDLFVLKLGAGDADGDGLDDDWEMAYFGNLSRDGFGDFDQDGMTDKQEFLAGTDPTNANSVLRVFALSPLNGATTTLLWPATPGRLYRLQYKTNVTDIGWQDHPASPNISAGTASVIVTNLPNAHRFYRAVLVP